MRKKGKLLCIVSNQNAASDDRADVGFLEKSKSLVIIDLDYL